MFSPQGTETQSSSVLPANMNSTMFDRLVVILSVFLALSGFVVLPVAWAYLSDRGWGSLIHIAWLFLPSICVIASLRDWCRERRVAATSDIIVSCGVACIWLLLVVVDIGRPDSLAVESTPYYFAGGLLILTIFNFLIFVRFVDPDGDFAHSTLLGWLYWALFGTCLLVMAVTYLLAFSFELLAS